MRAVALLLLAAACAAAPVGGGAQDGTPRVVRAKCGGCHGLPAPDPARDNARVMEAHRRRVPLDADQAAEVRAFLDRR